MLKIYFNIIIIIMINIIFFIINFNEENKLDLHFNLISFGLYKFIKRIFPEQ